MDSRTPRPMSDERLNRNLKIVALTCLSLALAAVVYLFLARIKLVVVILIGAVFFAYLIYPAVHQLERRFPRWLAIAVVYLAIALVVSAAIAYIGPVVGFQARNLARDFPLLVSGARDAILSTNASILGAIPFETRLAAANGLNNLLTQVQSAAGVVASQVIQVIASLASIVTVLILVPLLAFYILLDIERLRDGVVALFPIRLRDRAVSVLADIDVVVGGFVRGQLIVCAIVAILVTVMLLIFRIKYALLIGLFAGIIDIIPYVGAFAGAIPAVVLAIFEHGVFSAFLVILGFLVIYELEGHIIAPAIVGQRVGLTPLLVIVSILIGAELGGIGGMFVAVPMAGIIKVMWKQSTRPHLAAQTPDLAPPAIVEPPVAGTPA
jgi:predicted PurR-regulated permease PerM